MPYRPQGLKTSDNPKPHLTKENRKVYIPDETPPAFTSKKKLFKGGNNVAYSVRIKHSNKPMVYRESLHAYNKDDEEDYKNEIIFTIKFSTAGICPKIFGYGYDPDAQRYWMLSELYDMSLAKFVQSERTCSHKIRHIEEEMVKLFNTMIKHSFCYDIHPRNVVVSRDGQRVRLIDFDNKYCTKRRAGGHSINQTDLLVATLIVFSINHQGKLCGKRPYFQKILREMMEGGPARRLITSAPNLKKIESFLNKVHAQMKGSRKHLFTARAIMRYWRTGDRDHTPVSQMIQEVLYGHMNSRNYLVL